MSRTVLVTGGSGGIGAAVVTAFARQGDRVIVGCNTNLTAAQELCALLKKEGGEACALSANVADEAQVNTLFDKAEERYGAIEVLVNCAGIAQQKMFCDITTQDWDTMMDVNAKGLFLCCRRALPAMVREKKGIIINISSVWGQVGASCEVHYSAAKAAVIGLTKALAKEVAQSGIRVNCVAPGAVETPMLDVFSLEDRKLLAAEIPIGRLGLPEEMAAAVLFLASDAAAYFCGQVLAPNGGMVV